MPVLPPGKETLLVLYQKANMAEILEYMEVQDQGQMSYHQQVARVWLLAKLKKLHWQESPLSR